MNSQNDLETGGELHLSEKGPHQRRVIRLEECEEARRIFHGVDSDRYLTRMLIDDNLQPTLVPSSECEACGTEKCKFNKPSHEDNNRLVLLRHADFQMTPKVVGEHVHLHRQSYRSRH